MKNLTNKNGELNKLVRMLIEGLNSPNYYDYVDLLVSNLCSELENWDSLCWYPNDNETLWMIFEESSCSIKDSIRYFMTSEYDWDAPFIHVSDLATMEYAELRDLYLQAFININSYYEGSLVLAINNMKDELIDLYNDLNEEN